MKLKPNMYVRTKEGEIGKVISNETIEFQKDYAKIEYVFKKYKVSIVAKEQFDTVYDLIKDGLVEKVGE